MKILICPKCNKKQSSGKFCLDDGSPLKEIITNEVKFNKIQSKKTHDALKRDIRIWLSRIGVQQSEIKIRTSDDSVEVEYTIGKNRYLFSSHMQQGIQSNLAAIEQFLHYRVLGIERGIETTEQAFAGYESLPDFTGMTSEDPYIILGAERTDDIDLIRIKFKNLAKRYHPDINKGIGSDLQFQRIKRAMDEIEKERVN